MDINLDKVVEFSKAEYDALYKIYEDDIDFTFPSFYCAEHDYLVEGMMRGMYRKTHPAFDVEEANDK